MAPMCRTLEFQLERLKKKEGKDEEVKNEAGSEPSPKKPATDYEKKLKNLLGDTSFLKTVLNALYMFSEDTNLDCLHPAAVVVEAMTGNAKDQYASQLESWFESYAHWRGLKGKIFKKVEDCAVMCSIIVLLWLMPPRQLRRAALGRQ